MIQKEIKVCQQCGGLYVPQGGMFAGKPCVCKYPTELATPPLPQPVKEAQITMNRDFFEHLLNCMANMEIKKDVNADGISEGMDVIRRVQKDGQDACDKAYHQARELFHNGIQPEDDKEVAQPVKAVRAYAAINGKGEMVDFGHDEEYLYNALKHEGCKTIPVLITPVSAKTLQQACDENRKKCGELTPKERESYLKKGMDLYNSTKTKGEEKMNPFLSNLYDEFSGERKRREELQLKLDGRPILKNEWQEMQSKLAAHRKALEVAVKALYEVLSPTGDLSKAKEALIELNSLTNET